MNNGHLKIGTRGSRLALTQTNMIAQEIRDAHPGLEVETVIIHTTGDKILDSSLSRIGGKGLFTKEIEQALIDGKIDVAVHSLKDLPTQQPDGLALGAVSKRELPNDLLLAREPLDWKDLGPDDAIGTSSLRRRAQIMARNRRVQVKELRGNVPTRIRRMIEGEYTAILLAAAGVRRLEETAPYTLPVPFDEMLPAPGQGSLGLQIRANDERAREILSAVHDEESAICCEAERLILHALGGGCQLPLGTHARFRKESLLLTARVVSLDGAQLVEDEIGGPIDQWRQLAQDLAERLLSGGGDKILREIETTLTDGYEEAAARAQALKEKPLGGMTVLVTRDEDTDGPLSRALREEGADPLCMPLVQHLPPEDDAALQGAAEFADRYDWIVFTSARGVDSLADALEAAGKNLGSVNTPIACVGGATARRVAERGAEAELVPDEANANALIAAFEKDSLKGKTVLFPRADRARPTLAEGLRNLGADVTDPIAYRTVPHPAARSVLTELRAGRIHAILFTSASAAETLAAILEENDRTLLQKNTIGAIGQTTANELADHEIKVDFTPEESSFESLVKGLVEFKSGKG